MSHSYRISNGMLSGPEGSWQIAKITSVYKKTGDKTSWEKWLLTLAGITVASWPGVAFTLGIPIAAGAMAYYAHQTKRVYIVMDGREIELFSVVYVLNVPFLSEEEANNECDALINFIRPHIR